MSRQYGRIKVSIWNDDDFRDLSDGAQALYLRLLSHPSMTLAGVCDWRPKRVAQLTRDMTAKRVEQNAEELFEMRYVAFDEDTDECLVRTFVKHENVVASPKTAAGLAACFNKVVSHDLRTVIGYQLRIHREQMPDLPGWDLLSDWCSYSGPDRVSDWVSGWVPDRSWDGSPDDQSILLKPGTINQEPSDGRPLVDHDRVEVKQRQDRFDEFWEAMPKRGRHSNPKEPAREKWNALVRTIDPDALIAAALVYARNRQGEDPQHTAQAKTWLNQKRWTETYDEPAQESLPPDQRGSFVAPEFPEDAPRSLFVPWNRAHRDAWLAGNPGPSDWHDLPEAQREAS